MSFESKTIWPAVSCHAFNKDGSLVALSPNNHQVHIYQVNGDDFTKWTLKYTLNEHGGFVSDIDWSPVTDSIVTCGHDRNAYVWTYDKQDDVWKPSLVVLRINRAATAVKWSPDGKKFAVASGTKAVPVCHYEESNKWWICKMVKKHKSTVLSVAWSPNSRFIITGCTDNKARIFSAFIKGVDSKEDDGFEAVFPDQHAFGEIMAEFDAKAWVRSVAWSPQGYRAAFSSHGSTVTFIQLEAGASPVTQVVPTKGLPLLDIAFLTNNSVVGVGFDCNPAIFKNTGSEWTFQENVDKNEQKAPKTAKQKSHFAAALGVFADSASKGIEVGQQREETVLNTRHQNTINDVWVLNSNKFSTSSIDGRILFWDLNALGINVAV